MAWRGGHKSSGLGLHGSFQRYLHELAFSGLLLGSRPHSFSEFSAFPIKNLNIS